MYNRWRWGWQEWDSRKVLRVSRDQASVQTLEVVRGGGIGEAAMVDVGIGGG
jgi:hypothetical protein